MALSGLVAFAPSSNETNEMDKCLLALARKALRGEATCIDGHMRTRSSKWIWKQLKLAPTVVALAVQRLLWRQQIVGDPSSAWSFLFVFCGCVPGLPDVVDNSGAATPFAHSWLRLLVSDLQRLNNVLQLDDLDDAVDCPAKLFTDAEVKETFLLADVHVLVAEWSTERIPPPNVPRDEHVLLPPVVESELELPFVCEQALQDGTLCSAAFPTKIALAAHQTHFKKHARGVKRCVASALYVAISAAIAARSWRAEHVCEHISQIPRDEFFVEPRLPKEAQRSELLNFLRCLVLCVVRSCQKMVRHLLTWLHIFAHFSRMVIWSTNVCLRARCCSLNTYMIDSRRVLCSFECDSAQSFLVSQMENWQ